MDEYLRNLSVLLFGSLLLVAGAVVVGAFTAVCVAAWISKGRPNPYDFDEHADTAMAILTPDDPQLQRVEQWMRDRNPELNPPDLFWGPDGSHDDIHLTPAERADLRALEDLARRSR